MPRAPTAVIEQIITDLTELQDTGKYPATAGIIRRDEWHRIQDTIRLLDAVLVRRAEKIKRSLNTDWAWDVKHEQDMPDPEVTP